MHMKRVFIASNDPHTRAWVRAGIGELDVHVTDGVVSELRQHVVGGLADLVILDAGGRDSESLLQSAEDAIASGGDVSVLALVESDGLAALRLPVRMKSDFAVRGASSAELVARVRNLLWPGEEQAREELMRVENLTLNLATYQAHIDGEPVDFTYLEYALFAFLVTHPGRTYSREALLRRVWGTDYYGGSRTVDVHIRRIRSKIGAELSRHLETVRNVGYLWST